MADREMGTVKWFNNVRGYGFITRGAGGEDIFVHYRNIRAEGYRSLAEGQNVEFQLQQGDKGLQAEDVVLLS
ncbi:cold shock domain-containing protein [Cellvibrio sp. NN19]|uniref:cold-shock protein n=1 Tax=Cellvibrio chitinivorans TaxID=3102792 RepID=UPI002B40B759|nr:cold shock domain-containing protein [Cellvibrio sp. NN19]